MKKYYEDATLFLMKQLLEKFFKWGIMGMFLLVPMAYISWWVSPYVTSKLFLLMGIVDILIAIWVWLMIMDVRYRLTKKMLVGILPVGLLLGALTVSSLQGVDLATSFFSTIESGTGLIMLYHAFFFCCMIASGVRVWGMSLVRSIGGMIVTSGVILSVATFFTSLTIDIGIPMLNNSQGGAMMGNVLFLGTFLLFAIFAGVGLFVFGSPQRKKIRYGMSVLVMLLSPTFFISPDIWKGLVPFSKIFSSPTYLLGGARMAAISLVIGVLVTISLWLLLSCKTRIAKGFGVAGLVLLSVGMIFGIHQVFVSGSPINNYFVHESGNRLIDWRAAVEGIKERPILGWGQENYRVVFQKNLDPRVFDPKQGNEVWTLHPHNNVLEVMVNGGLIGLVTYLGVIVSIITMAVLLYRKKIINAQAVAIFSGLFFAYILQNQMMFDTVVSYILFFGLIGVMVGLLDQSGERAERNVVISDGGHTFGWLTSMASVGLLIILVLLPMVKVSALYTIAHTTSEGRAARYYQLFNGVGSQSIQTGIPVFLDSFIRSYDSQKQVLVGNPHQRSMVAEEIEALIQAIDPVWEKRVTDYHLSLSLVQLENLAIIFKEQPSPEDLVRIKKYTERALALSPTDPQIYVTMAQTFGYLGDRESAVAMVDRALELNSNYVIAQRLKAILGQK